MNERNQRNWLEQVDRYVDGTLTPAERQAFEQRLRSDELLHSEVELAGFVDDSLRRSYAAPAVDDQHLASWRSGAALPSTHTVASGKSAEIGRAAFPPMTTQKSGRSAAGSRRPWRLAAAAMLMCATAWSWVLLRQSAPPDREPLYAQRPMSEIYEKLVASGFEPKWVCEDEQEFADTFRERQGVPLRLAEMPPEVEMAGLHYLPALTEQTTAMLARSGGKPVLVFVERADRLGNEPEQPFTESGLYLFRRELAELVMYELSPLAQPTVMEFLEVVPVEAAAEE